MSAGTNVDSGFFTSLEPNSTLSADDAVVPKPDSESDDSDCAPNDEKLALSAFWKDAKPPKPPLLLPPDANAPNPPELVEVAVDDAANAAKPLVPLNAAKPPNALPVVLGVVTVVVATAALGASSVDSKPCWLRSPSA